MPTYTQKLLMSQTINQADIQQNKIEIFVPLLQAQQITNATRTRQAKSSHKCITL